MREEGVREEGGREGGKEGRELGGERDTFCPTTDVFSYTRYYVIIDIMYNRIYSTN